MTDLRDTESRNPREEQPEVKIKRPGKTNIGKIVKTLKPQRVLDTVGKRYKDDPGQRKREVGRNGDSGDTLIRKRER